jgi:hypothetical protein
MDPEKGWYVRRLSALLRLDISSPEVYEERTIVATRDELDLIRVRFSLPGQGGNGLYEVIADVQQGAQITAKDRLGTAHYRFTLALPTTLRHGREHRYTMRYRVPDGSAIRPHYAYVPFTPCESLRVRVRFDPSRLPIAVWRLNRLAPRLLDEEVASPELLEIDRAGEVAVDFTDLDQGFGYGVGWAPAGVEHPPDGSA